MHIRCSWRGVYQVNKNADFTYAHTLRTAYIQWRKQFNFKWIIEYKINNCVVLLVTVEE